MFSEIGIVIIGEDEGSLSSIGHHSLQRLLVILLQDPESEWAAQRLDCLLLLKIHVQLLVVKDSAFY